MAVVFARHGGFSMYIMSIIVFVDVKRYLLMSGHQLMGILINCEVLCAYYLGPSTVVQDLVEMSAADRDTFSACGKGDGTQTFQRSK